MFKQILKAVFFIPYMIIYIITGVLIIIASMFAFILDYLSE